MSEINKDFISAIKQQIADYDLSIDLQEVGTVVASHDGVVAIEGLDNAVYSELLRLDNGEYALVFNLRKDRIEAILLGEQQSVKEGDVVHRTKKVVEVGVGDQLLGRVVDPFGRPLDFLGPINFDDRYPIERPAPSIIDRKPVSRPLPTGIKTIDALIPIGKGQRELIVSDKQLGKTAIALDTIINQKGKDVYCVYVSIGQKASSVARLVEKLKEKQAMSYTTVVLASADSSVPLQYIAPYAATSMAEYFMEKGKDVLIVYDDLSKHANAYRAISLLLKRPPGREAYPGDIFYAHSRLLERAAQLNDSKGGGSLTALPVIETQAGDISAYIPTNVISITDGQIFLQKELFNSRVRPAIDTTLSVSRIGAKAQSPLLRSLSGILKLKLAQYVDLQAFSKFDSDFDASTKEIIETGKRLTYLLTQAEGKPLTVPSMAISIHAFQEGYFDAVHADDVATVVERLVQHVHDAHPEVISKLSSVNSLSPELTSDLRKIYKTFFEVVNE